MPYRKGTKYPASVGVPTGPTLALEDGYLSFLDGLGGQQVDTSDGYLSLVDPFGGQFVKREGGYLGVEG